MGLFRGAVFLHGGGALKQPIKQPTETPTSTLALMGRFPSLMGRFPTLMGRFADFVLRGRFASRKSTGKQPIKKRGIKRFLRNPENRRKIGQKIENSYDLPIFLQFFKIFPYFSPIFGIFGVFSVL